MPQSDYYLCEADVVEIAETFFDQGATIIPDLDYLTPEPLIISTSEKLREILHGSNLSLLFVVSPQWQRSPLQFGSRFSISAKRKVGPRWTCFTHDLEKLMAISLFLPDSFPITAVSGTRLRAKWSVRRVH
jgi:hypothetical protein